MGVCIRDADAATICLAMPTRRKTMVMHRFLVEVIPAEMISDAFLPRHQLERAKRQGTSSEGRRGQVTC